MPRLAKKQEEQNARDREKWYLKHTNDKNRYFAYIISKDDNVPVGYVNFHFDTSYLKHSCGVIIEDKEIKGVVTKIRDLGSTIEFMIDSVPNQYFSSDIRTSRSAARPCHPSRCGCSGAAPHPARPW